MTIWMVNDIMEQHVFDFDTEKLAREHFDRLVSDLQDEAQDGWHEHVEELALYRCEPVTTVRLVQTVSADDDTEEAAKCRAAGWDFIAELDVTEHPPPADAALLAKANRELMERLSEATSMLESIPTWGTYAWFDVPRTVKAKLSENAEQIGSLIRERDRLHAKGCKWYDALVKSMAKVERLERTLAAEKGHVGLEGWTSYQFGDWSSAWERDVDEVRGYCLEAFPPEAKGAQWRWRVWYDGLETTGYTPTALEAMEAAESALRDQP